MSIASWTSPRVSSRTLPISRVMSLEKSSLRFTRISAARERISPPLGAGSAFQRGYASRAQATARSTSSGPESAKLPIRSEVSAGGGVLNGGPGGVGVLGPRVGEAADQVRGVGGVAVVERAARGGVFPGSAYVVAVALRHAQALSPPARADMSLVPRKLAPSAITRRGARMLPVSRPGDSSTTRSVAWQSPIISPATTTV